MRKQNRISLIKLRKNISQVLTVSIPMELGAKVNEKLLVRSWLVNDSINDKIRAIVCEASLLWCR